MLLFSIQLNVSVIVNFIGTAFHGRRSRNLPARREREEGEGNEGTGSGIRRPLTYFIFPNQTYEIEL